MIALLALLLACDTPAEPRSTSEASPVVTPATSTASTDAAPPAKPPARLGLGRPATPEEITAWDIDVDPSGKDLPPGKGTVAEGRALYGAQCAACHGLKGEGGIGPKVIGTEPSTGFGEAFEGHPRTIGNWWPHASTLFDYTRRAMPQTAPGSLTDDQTYALTAFLLAENGAVGADFVASAETLPKVEMPTKIEFVIDDRLETTAFR